MTRDELLGECALPSAHGGGTPGWPCVCRIDGRGAVIGNEEREVEGMWIILVLVLALLLGGIGLVVKVVWWLLIVAAVLLLVGAIGALSRRRG